MSGVRCQVSDVLFFVDKVVELVGGGSVIDGGLLFKIPSDPGHTS